MKVIITYASAGAGHFKAAEAIYRYLKENYRDIDIDFIDVLKESTLFFKLIYTWGYSFLIKYATFIWAIAFWLTYFKSFRYLTRPVALFVNYLNTKRFARLLINSNADYIVSTHFLTSEIAASLKIQSRINAKIITIITDFGVHPFWLSQGTDIYVVASDYTKELLIKEGIPARNIRAFGIPVSMKFAKSYDKKLLYKKFNLREDKFTLLIMTGSFGIGPIEQIVRLLYQRMQILVVCAKNKKLFLRLKKKNYPDVRVFSFIDNVEELMHISDVIVTKPGGLSTSELLAVDLAPIFISAIPGQESSNAKILETQGIGLVARDTKILEDKVLYYLMNPAELNNVKNKIKAIRKPLAVKDLCDAICKNRF